MAVSAKGTALVMDASAGMPPPVRGVELSDGNSKGNHCEHDR
jgi:hypothetical protein